MSGNTNLSALLKHMAPKLHAGEYVFSFLNDISHIDRADTIAEFKEAEGTTVVMERKKAEQYKLSYAYIASWITLSVHSSLEAVGLTAAFSAALAEHDISCNVIAGYHHDHIFVHQTDGEKAMQVLNKLVEKHR